MLRGDIIVASISHEIYEEDIVSETMASLRDTSFVTCVSLSTTHPHAAHSTAPPPSGQSLTLLKIWRLSPVYIYICVQIIYVCTRGCPSVFVGMCGCVCVRLQMCIHFCT